METRPVKEIVTEIRALMDEFCITKDKCEHRDEDMNACCHPRTERVISSCKWDICPLGMPEWTACPTVKRSPCPYVLGD